MTANDPAPGERGDGVARWRPVDRVRMLGRSAASGVLRLAPLSVWRRLFPKPALGVCYHVVSDSPPPHIKHYRALTPAQFEADLAYLRRHFHFISYRALEQRQASGRPIRDNAFALSFDDGFAEAADVVAPLLGRLGLSCIFFVITDLIDNQRMFAESRASLCVEAVLGAPFDQIAKIVEDLGLTARLDDLPARPLPTELPLEVADLGSGWDRRLRPLLRWLLGFAPDEPELLGRLEARLGLDPGAYLRSARPYLTRDQIRRLADAGFTIGAHSLSHRRLQLLPPAEAEREIVESCRIVCDLTGQATAPFAFPYFGGDLDRAWLAGIRAANPFVGLYFDTDGLREDEPFVVQRVFGERFGADRSLDASLRRAWSRPAAWRRSARASGAPGSTA